MTFCKVLVRYNPEGDKDMNTRQTRRLRQLSEYLHHTDRKYMFELVPATPEQLQQVGGDHKRYDLERRPALMVRAIRELQEAGVEPDIWKIEGLDRREDCVQVAETARRDGRGDVGCIVLGREDEAHVHTWLTTAAGVPGRSASPSDGRRFGIPSIAWREQQTSSGRSQRRDRPALSAVGRGLREGACIPTEVYPYGHSKHPSARLRRRPLRWDAEYFETTRRTYLKVWPTDTVPGEDLFPAFPSTPASDHDRLGDAHHAAAIVKGQPITAVLQGWEKVRDARWSTTDRYRAPRW